MPPKTRGSKNSKALKENADVNCKTKEKISKKVPELPRKALADKTNSASDDNISLQSKSNVRVIVDENLLATKRPRRNKRCPTRYIENNDVHRQSKMNIVSVEDQEISQPTHNKISSALILSPLKTPKIILDSSLTSNRPKRICRLPSRFDDHSISPSKFIPVQPAYASTPKIVNKPVKLIKKAESNKKVTSKRVLTVNKGLSSRSNNKRGVNKKANNTIQSSSANSSADTNNNAKTNQLPRNNTKTKQNSSQHVSGTSKSTRNKKFVDKNFSFKILEDPKKTLKREASHFDVYEFTYDPNEEPPPQKKKRKKPTKKREPKPKLVVFKDNYSKNLAKALTALKKTISKKSDEPVIQSNEAKELPTNTCMDHPNTNTVFTNVNEQPVLGTADGNHTLMKNYNSVRVEDIALDFEDDNCVNDINYSPVHSFSQPIITGIQNVILDHDKHALNNNSMNILALHNDNLNPKRSVPHNDPLNLRDDLSFFDDQPVASSSMNISARNPAASPWRVEFESLPIKWQVNTYVKPNMTPAFESSFINFNDGKKKHVYTNIVPGTETIEENNLPQIYEDYASKLKQTSIISFIKEVVEKNAKKKKMTPIKERFQLDNQYTTSVSKGVPLPVDEETPQKNAQNDQQMEAQITPKSQCMSSTSKESEDSADNCRVNVKENSNESVNASSKKKKNNKNVTYFGFDDNENNDQENVSPVKMLDKRRLRALKPCSRIVLQEINEQRGPIRAVAIKSKPITNSEAANTLFDQMKSATEPPGCQVTEPIPITESTYVTDVQNIDDDHSVHLFEDIEVVHHLKTQRKSYGKSKKTIPFRQNSISDSDVPPNDVAEQSDLSEEDDLLDLTFKLPATEPKKATRKKRSKKPKISKKEEQEVEAWAAGFNSMCEDIEEFDLVVE